MTPRLPGSLFSPVTAAPNRRASSTALTAAYHSHATHITNSLDFVEFLCLCRTFCSATTSSCRTASSRSSSRTMLRSRWATLIRRRSAVSRRLPAPAVQRQRPQQPGDAQSNTSECDNKFPLRLHEMSYTRCDIIDPRIRHR